MRRFLQTCVLVATLVPAAGCDVFGIGDDDIGIEELRENRAKWRQQGLTSYSYVLQRTCFCGTEATRPVRITVMNGVRQSAVYVESGAAVPAQWLELFPTMEGLFDLLEDALERADDIAVTYDITRGHPLRAEIDYIERAVDDELALAVSQVKP